MISSRTRRHPPIEFQNIRHNRSLNTAACFETRASNIPSCSQLSGSFEIGRCATGPRRRQFSSVRRSKALVLWIALPHGPVGIGWLPERTIQHAPPFLPKAVEGSHSGSWSFASCFCLLCFPSIFSMLAYAGAELWLGFCSCRGCWAGHVCAHGHRCDSLQLGRNFHLVCLSYLGDPRGAVSPGPLRSQTWVKFFFFFLHWRWCNKDISLGCDLLLPVLQVRCSEVCPRQSLPSSQTSGICLVGPKCCEPLGVKSRA